MIDSNIFGGFSLKYFSITLLSLGFSILCHTLLKQVRLIHQETVDIADSSVYNLEYCIRRLLSVLAYYDLVVKSWHGG